MIFKLIIKVLIIGIVLFGIGNYASYLLTGKTPSFFNKPPSLPKINVPEIRKTLTEKIDSFNDKSDATAEAKQLYKWRDDKGVIHYTSEQPIDMQNVETITYYNDTNVVPAISAETAEEEPASRPSISQTESGTLPADIPDNLYSPEGVKQLIDQAKGVQNQVNEHYDNLENQINNN